MHHSVTDSKDQPCDHNENCHRTVDLHISFLADTSKNSLKRISETFIQRVLLSACHVPHLISCVNDPLHWELWNYYNKFAGIFPVFQKIYEYLRSICGYSQTTFNHIYSRSYPILFHIFQCFIHRHMTDSPKFQHCYHCISRDSDCHHFYIDHRIHPHSNPA